MNASSFSRALILATCLVPAACNGTLGPSASGNDSSLNAVSERPKTVHKPAAAKGVSDEPTAEPELPTEVPEVPAVEPDVVVPDALLAPAMQPAAPVAWQLSPADSYFSLITVKQTNIAEVHSFERFNAYVDETGVAAVAIDLSSIATNVDLRDSRVRGYLFEVGVFPEANVRLQLNMLEIDTIGIGEMQSRTVTASLDLHGVAKDITASVTVLRMSNSRITVQTKKPIILNAADFNMSAGIQALLELTGLVSISTAVPVEFMLSFDSTTGELTQ
jgi:polyisoprenoid-binding protein YceI